MRRLRPALLATMWCSRVRRRCIKKRFLNVQRSAPGAWKLRRKLSSLPRTSRTLELAVRDPKRTLLTGTVDRSCAFQRAALLERPGVLPAVDHQVLRRDEAGVG